MSFSKNGKAAFMMMCISYLWLFVLMLNILMNITNWIHAIKSQENLSDSFLKQTVPYQSQV